MKNMKMKKRSAALIAVLSILIALLFAGCQFGPGAAPAALTTPQPETVELEILPAQEETTQPETTEQPSAETLPEAEEPSPEPTEAPPAEPEDETPDEPEEVQQPGISEDSTCTSKDDVALYIHTYGHLPSNFVTKAKARDAGWSGGSLEKYYPGCSIGGDVFGNREGLLPAKKGRTYYECDIDTVGKSSRGAKRIVFSDDGLIFYTDDHYESFTLLYGEDE